MSGASFVEFISIVRYFHSMFSGPIYLKQCLFTTRISGIWSQTLFDVMGEGSCACVCISKSSSDQPKAETANCECSMVTSTAVPLRLA